MQLEIPPGNQLTHVLFVYSLSLSLYPSIFLLFVPIL